MPQTITPSRAKAFEIGALTELDETQTRDLGFRYPIAVTYCADCSPNKIETVLKALRLQILAGGHETTVLFPVTDRASGTTERLKCICEPDDKGLPSLTIMTESEFQSLPYKFSIPCYFWIEH
jgi:hypothetical protein